MSGTRKTRAPAAAAARNDPRERLRRVLFLVPYAVRHRGIPVKDLARKCGVSEKELLEDLDFLLGVGCPPFAPDDFLDLYVEGDKVYVALHQSFSRPPRFTESEAAALAAAAQALGGEGRDRAVQALRDAVPRDRRASYDELVGRIYAGAPPAKDSVLGRIQRAIAERRAAGGAITSASPPSESAKRVAHSAVAPGISTTAPPFAVRRTSRTPGRAMAQPAASGPTCTRGGSPSASEKRRARASSASPGGSTRSSVIVHSRTRSRRNASAFPRAGSWPYRYQWPKRCARV